MNAQLKYPFFAINIFTIIALSLVWLQLVLPLELDKKMGDMTIHPFLLVYIVSLICGLLLFRKVFQKSKKLLVVYVLLCLWFVFQLFPIHQVIDPSLIGSFVSNSIFSILKISCLFILLGLLVYHFINHSLSLYWVIYVFLLLNFGILFFGENLHLTNAFSQSNYNIINFVVIGLIASQIGKMNAKANVD